MQGSFNTVIIGGDARLNNTYIRIPESRCISLLLRLECQR